MMRSLPGVACATILAFAPLVPAHEHQHTAPGNATGRLGEVHFPTSCHAVDAEFTRAVALLHSFGYEEARLAFGEVVAKDPACAMAYWACSTT